MTADMLHPPTDGVQDSTGGWGRNGSAGPDVGEGTVRTPRAAAIRSEGRLHAAFKTQIQVIHALMLHDIKSRFFGNGFGYVATILWPSAHIAMIVGIFIFTGRQAPYGDDRLLYVSIGVLPYIIWNYISRFTLLGLIMNKSFLQYPLIKPLDIMIARQALEVVSCTIITVGLALILMACQADVMPHHPDQAALAILSAVLLGIGFGIFNGVICMIFPLWNIIYVGVLIGFWVTSGVVINPEALPTPIGDLLAWNPLLHCIEWLRLAYYDDFPARLLDKSYVVYCGAGSLACGLVMERALRFLTMA